MIFLLAQNFCALILVSVTSPEIVVYGFISIFLNAFYAMLGCHPAYTYAFNRQGTIGLCGVNVFFLFFDFEDCAKFGVEGDASGFAVG